MQQKFPEQLCSYISRVQQTAAECARYCTAVLKELLHPKYHRWCCKSIGLGVCCQKHFGSCGRDSSGWKFQGQCHVRISRGDKARYELAWDIICVTVTLVAASEDQSPLSAEVCQVILALQGGWGEQ